jgi:xylulokinase
MTDPLLIGADIGTTKTKAAAFTLEGRVVASAATRYAMARERGGWVEQDPEDYWSTLGDVLSRIGDEVSLSSVRAVGVCSQVNTHVFADSDGRPVRPAITWQDQRCADVAEMLDGRVGDALRAQMGGADFHLDASSLLARVEWVRRNEPEAWAATRWVMTPKDFVNLRLTGTARTDPLSSIGLVASSGSGYLELDEVVEGVSATLPPLGDLATSAGRTAGDVLGLPPGTPVAIGTMDAWGSVYGSGVTGDRQGFLVSGTSEIIGVVGMDGSGARGAVAFPVYGGMRLFAGPTQAGGDALRWFSEIHGHHLPWPVVQADGAPAGSDGLVFLPHLAGERAPLWDPNLRGAFVGLRLDHGEDHLCRAVLEGVAYSARHLLEVLEEASGARPDELALSGGGAVSDLWSQIKADAMGRPLRRLQVLDSGVLGAALFAGVAAGVLPDLKSAAAQMVGTERVFEPRHQHAAVYEEGYRFYRAVQAALTPVFHERARAA